MLFRSLFLSFFVFSSASAKDPFHVDIDITLKRLDSLIISNDDYVRNKKILLKELKSKANSGTPEEIYWKNKNVYNEYKTFDSDSSLVWLNKLDELSENLNNKDEIINNKIERSFILAATGLLLESLKTAEEINTCHLSLNGKKKYYNQMSYLYSHLHQYAVSSTLNDHPIQVSRGSYYQLKQLNYIDSIQMCTLPTDEDYMWNMAWKYRETDSLTYYRELLEKKLSGRSFNQRNDAMLLYALSHLYAQEDDRTGMINALAYSAMADIRCANREIASLQELSRHLFEHDDIDRAYSYISLCLKNAQIYKARSRAIDIANVMDTLYDMNMACNAERESKLKQSLIGLLIFTIFAFFGRSEERMVGEECCAWISAG